MVEKGRGMSLRLVTATVLLALSIGGAAAAQDRAAGVEAVLACRSVKHDKAQLACFRRAAAMLGEAPAAAPPAETAAATPSSAPPAAPAPVPFGARPPRVEAKGPPPVRQVSLTVKSVGDLGDGRAIMTFTDGSTWRETDPDPLLGAVRPGQVVVIAKGALSGYLLELPHRSVIHVVRMRDD
jgi:hypothetical protein